MDGLYTAANVASAGGVACLLFLAIVAFFRRRSTRTEMPAAPVTKRTRLVGTFTVRDSRGRAVTLSTYQQYFDAGTRDDPTAERRGAIHILTPDGRRAEKIGTRKYRVLGTRDVLTTDDVNAP